MELMTAANTDDSIKKMEDGPEGCEETENRVFTFDHTKEDSPSRIPTREEIINTFFGLCAEHHANWQYITLFYHELFYRVFGVPLYYRERSVKYKDGKIELTDGDVYSDVFHMDIEAFQKFYDKSIACILNDYAGNYMFFFEETIICAKIVDGGKYMVVNGILSNLEPYRILEILEGTKKYNIKIDKSKFYIAIATKNGIYTKQHELKKMEIDVNKCYNDDIPYERVKEILSKDGKSLILFYGEPGTGKTTLIKKLINEVERKFIFMDASVVTNISDNDFIDFLSDNAGSVIVLEDCEKMLVSREQSNNQTIGTVLNLTDGIIGESFEVKFICTFNSDLKFVDDAILRKGRLSLKYEFKKLPVEKVRAIYPDATGEMTLADAYNATEENDFSKVERGKIGF
jgi:hypothetical protein